MNIGFAEQLVSDNPDAGADAARRGARSPAARRCPSCATWSAASTRRCWPSAGSTGPCARSRSACRCPSTLHIDLPGRPRAPVESAAYFAIAEALANVVKHSGANRAWVQLDIRPTAG